MGQMKPLRVALFAYPDLQALDLSGPFEMFARATRLLRDHNAYRSMTRAISPYGDGRAAGRIVARVGEFFGITRPVRAALGKVTGN